jgi:hypothetical protein
MEKGMLRSLLISAIAVTVAVCMCAAPSFSGTFSCTCKNGTLCTVTCGCTGAVSCGYDKCANRCGACTRDGTEAVAMSLGSAVYETNYIVRTRDYTPKDLVADFGDLLSDVSIKRASEGVKQVGADKALYVVLRKDTGEWKKAVLFPEAFLKQTADILKVVQERAPEIAAEVQGRLKELDWSK